MVGWHESDDKCAICVHEHENWGNNEHCRKCKKEEKDKSLKTNDINKIKLCTLTYDCPYCEQPHEIHKIKYLSKAIVKNDEVEYLKQAYYCDIEDDEFVPSDIEDSNLAAARETYRVKNDKLEVNK